MHINRFYSILFILFLFITPLTNAQAEYEAGYFINDQGEKVNCLIKNERWEVNPEEFEYKLNESSAVKVGNIDDVQMFAVEGVFKYEKATVKIDKETDGFVDVNNNPDLDFVEKELYLNKVVEGKVNLYHYQEEGLDIFFTRKRDADEFEQLIFKRYKNEDYNDRMNNKYRGQIYKAFDSKRFKRGDFKRLDYNLRELKDIFIEYNRAFSDFQVNYQRFKLEINVYAKLGAHVSSFYAEAGNGLFEADFSNEINVFPGAEFELKIPFSLGKWSLFTSPAYLNYSSSLDSGSILLPEDPESAGESINEIDYSSLLIPVGFRRYFAKQNSDFRFYLNAAYVFDVTLNEDLVLLTEAFKIKPTEGFNLQLGGGIQFKQFGLEFLYFTDKDLLEDSQDFDTNFQTMAINFTYRIL